MSAVTTSRDVQHPVVVHQKSNLFTLTFLGGEIAILEVRGAADQEQARGLAEKALPRCRYSVSDGDITEGHAELFYLWCTNQEGKR